ncbi:MAG: hypothetical protein BGO42_11375 [Flavobacterium sp. 40-81]|nr:MAG: hypothetical protein ABS44_16135 [Chryseobacterium sp. SCN 40-13]OJV70050.1 MAG: hypothetical protein BGO42_11375 [Flavobacterium sp. 40-81]
MATFCKVRRTNLINVSLNCFFVGKHLAYLLVVRVGYVKCKFMITRMPGMEKPYLTVVNKLIKYGRKAIRINNKCSI